MADEEGFSNRPFAGLAAKKAARKNDPDSQERDHEIFMAAINRIPPPKAAPDGFALSLICPAWPQGLAKDIAGKMKKARKKTSKGPEPARQKPANQIQSTDGADGEFRTKPANRIQPTDETDGQLREKPEIASQIQPTDDEDEFMLAMRSVTPLAGKGRAIAQRPSSAPMQIAAMASFEESVEKSMEFALFSSEEYLEGHVVGLDDLVTNRLKEGHFSPEDHLDLHGLNAIQAFEALRSFIRQAWYKGLRCVLLVPGRGRNSPQGLGVLRGKLQAWLTQDPFKRVVLAFCTARPHDGGAGGVYVLLRRNRKKGRIYWERLPSDADLY